MAIVAAYLLHLAYQLFQGRNDPNTTMAPAVVYLFVALFALAAAGLIVYAWRLWKSAPKEEEPSREENENSLK